VKLDFELLLVMKLIMPLNCFYSSAKAFLLAYPARKLDLKKISIPAGLIYDRIWDNSDALTAEKSYSPSRICAF